VRNSVKHLLAFLFSIRLALLFSYKFSFVTFCLLKKGTVAIKKVTTKKQLKKKTTTKQKQNIFPAGISTA